MTRARRRWWLSWISRSAVECLTEAKPSHARRTSATRASGVWGQHERFHPGSLHPPVTGNALNSVRLPGAAPRRWQEHRNAICVKSGRVLGRPLVLCLAFNRVVPDTVNRAHGGGGWAAHALAPGRASRDVRARPARIFGAAAECCQLRFTPLPAAMMCGRRRWRDPMPPAR
jgi:hypothetical protein